MARTQMTMKSSRGYINASAVVITQVLSANWRPTIVRRTRASMEVTAQRLSHISVARAPQDFRTVVTTAVRITSMSARQTRARMVVRAAMTTTAR